MFVRGRVDGGAPVAGCIGRRSGARRPVPECSRGTGTCERQNDQGTAESAGKGEEKRSRAAAEGSGQRAEGSGQRAAGSGQRAEGRGQRNLSGRGTARSDQPAVRRCAPPADAAAAPAAAASNNAQRERCAVRVCVCLWSGEHTCLPVAGVAECGFTSSSHAASGALSKITRCPSRKSARSCCHPPPTFTWTPTCQRRRALSCLQNMEACT